MFHFTKNDRIKEAAFIKKIIKKTKEDCLIVFCIQDTVKKVEMLYTSINFNKKIDSVVDEKFEYIFVDNKTGHKSKTDYRMIVVKK